MTLLISLLIACAGLHAETLDRIVAKANRQPILLSQVQDEIRFQEISGEAASAEPQISQALQRVIDRVLIEQEIARALVPDPDASVVKARLAEFKAHVAAGGNDDAWRESLVRFNLTEEEIRDRLAEEIRISGYIDSRFRSTVSVDRTEVADYYEKTLVPGLQARHLAVPALRDVSAQITEILIQQRITVAMNDWLQTLRKEAEIEIGPDIDAQALGIRTATAAPQ